LRQIERHSRKILETPMFLFDAIDPTLVQEPPTNFLWLFLPVGYLVTILIETPVLIFGLAPKITFKQKLLCGVWLTACTYPVVVLVLPTLMLDYLNTSRGLYLAVAETFAPLGECFFFWLAFRGKGLLGPGEWLRCLGAIIIANLASFLLGEVLNYYGWFGLFNY
jgi:hypothetical protein